MMRSDERLGMRKCWGWVEGILQIGKWKRFIEQGEFLCMAKRCVAIVTEMIFNERQPHPKQFLVLSFAIWKETRRSK